MAREVQSALGDISVELGGYSQEDAKAWVKELKTQGRYLEDVWS